MPRARKLKTELTDATNPLAARVLRQMKKMV